MSWGFVMIIHSAATASRSYLSAVDLAESPILMLE